MKLKNNIPKELIESAVKFHGHLGPFLILGLKAGLYANEVLGRDPFGMKVIVETEPKPPPHASLMEYNSLRDAPWEKAISN